MSIGILGGGQLGYMLALAGYPIGLRFRFSTRLRKRPWDGLLRESREILRIARRWRNSRTGWKW